MRTTYMFHAATYCRPCSTLSAVRKRRQKAEAMTHVWSRASFSRIRKERRLVQAEEALLTIQYMFCADDSDWAPRGDNLGLFDGDGCVW